MEQAQVSKLMQAALEEAARQGVPITVAVVDDGGHLRGLMRQEGCSYFAIDVSRRKALTASQLKMPTHVLGEVAQKFPALQSSFASNPDIETLPGGVPVIREGRVLGGLGVAGGNFGQDQSIAEKAIKMAVED